MIQTGEDKARLREKDLSKASLQRLRFLFLMGMPCFPVLLLTYTDSISTVFRIVLLICLIISCICFGIVVFSRLIRRFELHEKQLDEWEIDIKRSADAFSYRMIFCVIGLMFVPIILTQALMPDGPIFSFNLDQISTRILCIVFLLFYPRCTYILWTIRPIESEDTVKSTPRIGRNVAVLVACILISVFAVQVADMVYDASYDYKAKCDERGVKSVNMNGLFKNEVECF